MSTISIMRWLLGVLLGVQSCSGLWAHSSADSGDLVDSQSIAELFYTLNGESDNPHKKINHTKGFCAVGELIPAQGITKTYDIPLLEASSIPVQVRFSLGGGNTMASDSTKIRGMGLKIQGMSESWEMALLNTQINFAKNLEEFVQFLEVNNPQKSGVCAQNAPRDSTSRPDAQNQRSCDEILASTKSFANYKKYLATLPLTPSVAHTIYHSVHTFYFQDSKGRSIPARFAFIPVAGERGLSTAQAKKLGDEFLQKDFKTKIAHQPIEYKMVLILANPSDVTNDTTALWEGKHQEVQLATLRVTKYTGEGCNGDVFMPIVLPKGVGAPKDPLFETRSEVYGLTFGRRQ